MPATISRSLQPATLYTEARERHPVRWARNIRNGMPVGALTLNTEHDSRL